MELEADLYASVRACHASTAFWGSVVTCWLASEIADAASARGRRPGNLVVVAGAEPFTPRQREEVDRAVRRLPLPARTWSVDDPALPRT